MPLTRLGLLISLFFVINSVRAQDAVPALKQRPTILLEILGSGGHYSLNYEAPIKQGRFSLRIGFSFWKDQFGDFNDRLISFPLSAVGTLGKKNNKFVFGLGATPCFETSIDWISGGDPIRKDYRYIAGSLRCGYRYQRNEGSFFFELNATPQLALVYSGAPGRQRKLPWFGFSLGKTLKARNQGT